MEEEKFIVETMMKHEDYRKFLYIATFLKRSSTLPMLAVIAFFGALFIVYSESILNLGVFVFLWFLIFIVAVATVCFGVERKYKRRIETDQAGTFDSKNILIFYSEYMVMETPSLKGSSTLNYSQFYQLLESRDYFIFYVNANQGSLLRKRDICDRENFENFISSKFEGRYKTVGRFFSRNKSLE